MHQTHDVKQIAEEAIQTTGFASAEVVTSHQFYTTDWIRNIVYKGIYNGVPAILKVYDYPRPTDEARSLAAFRERNTNTRLTAPKVLANQAVSTQTGWLITEQLPDPTAYFKAPLSSEERKIFLDLFSEYRNVFPKTPTRPLTLAEELSAADYHIFRINRWLEYANNKETELLAKGESVLRADELLPRYEKALALIRSEFEKRKMIWCHGHFKPNELYALPDGRYCLTNFAHTKMYPEGYEFGFIIWADAIMGADWNEPYELWEQRILSWIDDFAPVAAQLEIRDFSSLMRVSLLERIMGTILADVCATDQQEDEKKYKVERLYRLFDCVMQ